MRKDQQELQLESRAIGGHGEYRQRGKRRRSGGCCRGLRPLQAVPPSVQLDLQTGNAEQIREKVDRGLLDLAVLMEPVDVTPFHSIEIPVLETWGVLMPGMTP